MKHKLKRLYDFFRYDLPRFVKNVWIYRRAIAGTYNFDYSGSLHYLKIHLEQLEPCLRNGYHLRGDKTADRVKTCRILLERILENSSQYQLYNYDFDFSSGRFIWRTIPKNSLHPREGTKLYAQVMKNKEKQDWDLLMKLLHKHMRSYWD